ncbi:SusD/RagB family nutrient-binding outer membrane lipoprotein [Chitinophaga solisilvae]|uniref:SusD/RagB family nutrient-binding outer membrane lipoprotein n=1 Tax=Chitinophaga solisilvae TaxID=1233460 RepID=A0A3S1D2V0_9BACT|nr:SusD/RagB family nutrient-binding outer membrane lipoprotein [Chitinophaga solisilvae]NSL90477.1 SusD/RagB family nutrient-binding outer membrane lipoprotein [Chitinophaga solisilvae]
MKKIRFKLYTPLAVITLMMAMLSSSCTKNFEEYNTDNTGLTDDMLVPDFMYIGGFFPQIQSSIYFNFGNTTGDYQLQQNLMGDVYSGYMMPPNNFRGNINNMTYSLVDGWNQSAFNLAYVNVMAPIAEVRRRGAPQAAPEFWAIALILKVEAMHRVTDIYGPIPYSSFGSGGTSSSYDKQEDVYKRFFLELDSAVNSLNKYVAEHPGVNLFSKFDMLYAGDYKQWIKFGNSLRLRLAMRVSKVNRAMAKAEAEKALDPSRGGVMEIPKDNANVSGFGLKHPLYTILTAWTDNAMNASMESYLVGYKDPRLPKYYDHSTKYPGTYKGIRIGSLVTSKPGYTGYSIPAVNETKTFRNNTPIQLMTAAEVWFLRAEASLYSFANAGGTPAELYEKGVRTSLNQWDVDPLTQTSYLADNTSKPIDYVDPQNKDNNIAAMGKLSIKWDDAASEAVKLERIITQKWIAIYPEGQEAWSEYRRTGYPKLFPVVNNMSGGTINSDVQIRRIPFPSSEYTANKAEVEKAVQLLGTGGDNGGTRLWWDKP